MGERRLDVSLGLDRKPSGTTGPPGTLVRSAPATAQGAGVCESTWTHPEEVMPKNKKPAGGRAAKNFDPRYNPKYRAKSDDSAAGGGKRRPGESSTGKPGSRSAGHRGHRTEPGEGAAPERRWSAQEKVGRDEARAIRSHAKDDRPGAQRPRPDSGREDRPRTSRSGASRPPSDAPRSRQGATEDVVHGRLRAQTVDADAASGVSFAGLGLGRNLVNTLAELGAQHPFPIQAAAIPAILEGRDVLARGRTGSGKTIAFGAPLVEAVLQSQAGQKREFGRAPRALILAPTRELALQIDATIQPLARSVGVFTTQIYGGVPQARQVGALKKGVDIVIGTPGRIEDLVEQGRLDLSDIRITVLDEADHMCQLGFLAPVQRILRRTPRPKPGTRRHQRLLFSATLDRQVNALVDEFLADPAVFEVAGETQQSGTISHRVLIIDHRDKPAILEALASGPGKTLVFTRTRAYAEMLATQFEAAGIRAVALHGDLDQARRTRNLERLTSGRVGVLVATDVAARGIHVDDIDLVVQADPPEEYKTYVHRAGRTGRAGRPGTVVTLVTRTRRARMEELLERAEVSAPFEDARPGDAVLDELRARD